MKIKWWRVIRNNVAGAVTAFYGLAFAISVWTLNPNISFAIVTVVSLWLWHQMIADDRLDDDLESRIRKLERGQP